jgi:hypothetical protein
MEDYGIRKENDTLRINELRLKAQIEKLELENTELKEKFSLYGVSHRRELLKAFVDYIDDRYIKVEQRDLMIDEYLISL